jgi:tetratricopeptide (TPR) repeat protein
MMKIKSIAAVFVLIFLFSQTVFAAKNADSLKFAMLDIDTGARPSAMGSAFTGIAEGVSSVYWNPAGLSGLNMLELDLAAMIFLDTSFQYAAGALPIGYGTLAAEIRYMDFGGYELRDIYGAKTDGSIKAYNFCGSLGYGFRIADFLSAGAVVKVSGMSIDSESSSGILFDAGLLYSPLDSLSAGINFQNFDPSSGTVMPAAIRFGIGAKVLESDFNRVMMAVDYKYSDYYDPSFSAGFEYTMAKMFSFRLGYKYRAQNDTTGGLSGVTAGLGIAIDRLVIDYAFIPGGELGSTHLAEVKIFTESREQKEKQNFQKITEFLAYQYFRDGQDLYDSQEFEKAALKWEQVKDMAPEYAGIDAAIQKARRMKAGLGGFKKAEKIFNEGMEFYEAFLFQKAAKKWQEAKNLNPDYKDIDTWLADSKEMAAGGGMSKQAEKYFRQGLKSYNNCDYSGAVKSWQAGLEKDPANKKIKQYIERTKAKQAEIQASMQKAKAAVEKDTTVSEGIKKLRDIAQLCPAYKDAADILSTLKEVISMKTRESYFKGIEKYTDGNLDEAITYWKNIEALDPKSDYILKVKRYIEDARNKQKAIERLKK